MNVFVVNGYPGSGKTTFEKNVQKLLGEEFCKIFSTIDKVKEIAQSCGWNGTKTPDNRKFLSDLKDLLTKWNDVPLKDIQKKISTFSKELIYYLDSDEKGVVFVDCREPEEIEKLKQVFNATTIFIRRPPASQEEILNHADRDVENYQYDIVIDNDSGLLEFGLKAIDFASQFSSNFKYWKIDLDGNVYIQ